ncbi:hypothetical protein HUA74_41065 [Myxococcus sp. CA051A]|uniref:Uncharacterized protein n=1 Tax=Myxococcus llanfairpwllgwyngyllgogerychwyrndrobwllllantysiliogogogochensis TaxID=2590453 RepID=A0A540WK40_9BACT|nr:hypothetical protein [Myxococcus llanfairpwllgwyngyllgogerychwyrndrobwllllantysiliogogogochensis]NTX08339.1 hypothetical protein [Myxococcus sp. CA040A]NTX14705.1 hypothetical protein [Myxococcus sp. CA056]NTX40386.1 hypothetical protein [Myxococcus sp. CA033]NTX56983.1 hypothetical protein [Myxococcus sp. CA039A]NTX67058.1 hypothetical protein [Myxococcus sp. CA051A]
MSSLLLRLVCGLLFSALVLGAVVHPPDNLTQGLGMMLPASMLLGVALKGPRRGIIPKKKVPVAVPVEEAPPRA